MTWRPLAWMKRREAVGGNVTIYTCAVFVSLASTATVESLFPVWDTITVSSLPVHRDCRHFFDTTMMTTTMNQTKGITARRLFPFEFVYQWFFLSLYKNA